ncbi:MAG: hypothetical protein HOQ28_03395, partial [Thermoleophilia bacterium]|nr:hypothetical protein [Thermoleophilia bacterium]
MGLVRAAAAGLVAVSALAAVVGVVAATTPANVDVSQRHLNESEETIAVNPTNPKNIVVISNIGHREAGLTAGMFAAVSLDGGATWTRRLIGLGAGRLWRPHLRCRQI